MLEKKVKALVAQIIEMGGKPPSEQEMMQLTLKLAEQEAENGLDREEEEEEEEK
jgi:kinesin family protein 5